MLTVVGAFVSMVVLTFAIYKNLIPWRYVFFPFVISLQVFLFYIYVLIVPSPRLLNSGLLSAVIRWETVYGFLIGLLIYVWCEIRE